MTIHNVPTAAPDIDDLFQPSLDEQARQGFVSLMRRFALFDLKAAMEQDFQGKVQRPLERDLGHAADYRQIEEAMEPRLSYQVFSSIRYNVQEMVWHSVQPAVERNLPAMIETARAVAETTPAGGSLALDPDFAIPRYISAQDVHLVPGCFHSEYTKDDLAQGIVIAEGSKVFAGQIKGYSPGGVAQSVAAYLKAKFPDFNPRRVLDIGTQAGKNLLPYRDTYPETELYGLDASAPSLRYGHAKAEALGVPVHFVQQNAETMQFADGSFDLIVSSFFFHEIPVSATRKVLAECHRLLSPGGIMVHMELPPEKSCTDWQNFYWNWDTKYNNEPSYTAFRSNDPQALCVEAGFDAASEFEVQIPDASSFGPEKFARWMAGEIEAPIHGRGSWYVFGARKAG